MKVASYTLGVTCNIMAVTCYTIRDTRKVKEPCNITTVTKVSLAWSSSTLEVWPSQVQSVLTALSWLRLSTSMREGAIFTAGYLTLTVPLTLYFGYFFASQLGGCDCIGKCGNDELWVFITDHIFLGLLFIPAVQYIMEIVHCRPDGTLYENPKAHTHTRTHT
jgi:hypothetical protein